MPNELIPPDTEKEIVFDRESVFLLFCQFAGDVEQTAHAAGMRAVDVLRMAREEDWLERLRPILELQKSQKPGDYARGINRALCYSQARRYWLFLERVVAQVSAMNAEQVQEYIFPKDKDGNTKLATRALADLASAMEKIHSLCYQALSDTATDRGRRQEQANGSTDANASELHVRIAAAMSRVKHSATPRAQVFDAKLEIAQNDQKETETNGHTSSQ